MYKDLINKTWFRLFYYPRTIEFSITFWFQKDDNIQFDIGFLMWSFEFGKEREEYDDMER